MVTAPALDVVTCAKCRGVVLRRDYAGRWVHKHNGRTLRLHGRAMIEAECKQGHTVRVVVDGATVRVLD